MFVQGISKSKYKDKIRFIIVGKESSLSTIIRSLAKQLDLEKNIVMLSGKPHNEAFEYVLSSDAVPLLKTIDSYGLSPIKFYEALAAGLPQLVTDIPYINTIKELDYGVVLPVDKLNGDTVAAGIDEIIENKEKYLKQRENIIDYAAQNHLWKNRIELLIDTLTSIN